MIDLPVPEMPRWTREQMLSWPVVRIQNVQDYMRDLETGFEDRLWSPENDDFPCVVSPWPVAEYTWFNQFNPAEVQPGDPTVIDNHVVVESKQLEDGKFLESLIVLVPKFGPYFMIQYIAHADGTYANFSSGETWPEGSLQLAGSPEFMRKVDEVGADINVGDWLKGYYAILMAESFMACKNVVVREEAPKLTRQQRRHGPPAATYKVLDIGPMAKVLRDEGGSNKHGLQKALHICRGHFAHYTNEHPLFGKYEGTFWVPMHTRGSAERGIVIKDYNVSP